MLGDDLAAALPELRLHAESRMVDACAIASGGVITWDETTGTATLTGAATVYSGRCEIQIPNVTERELVAGERERTVQDLLVKLPVVGSEQVTVGATVTVTASTLDAALTGRVYTVVADHSKTFATARRLRCRQVTRG